MAHQVDGMLCPECKSPIYADTDAGKQKLSGRTPRLLETNHRCRACGFRLTHLGDGGRSRDAWAEMHGEEAQA